MRQSDDPALRDYDEHIANALRTEGGHLSIGRGGFTLYFARGRLRRYTPDYPRSSIGPDYGGADGSPEAGFYDLPSKVYASAANYTN